MRDEPVKPDFRAPQVALESCDAFKRVCYTCCDPVACGESIHAVEGDLVSAMPACPWRPRP